MPRRGHVNVQVYLDYTMKILDVNVVGQTVCSLNMDAKMRIVWG